MKRRGQYHAYLVECSDGTYYAGYSGNLEARLRLHNAGRGAKYCRWKRPVTLVYEKAYRYYKWAVAAERTLKRLTRAQKERLVRAYARTCSLPRTRGVPAGLSE